MKIAIAIKHYSLKKGGGERYAVRLCEAFAKRGHQIEVMSIAFETTLPPSVKPVHIKVIEKPSWCRNLLFARFAGKILNNSNHDISYALTQVYPIDVYRAGGGIYKCWLAKKYPQKALLLINCFLNPLHLVNLHIERSIFKTGNYKHIITNSDLCRKQIIQNYGIPQHRISVIYNGVDHSEFNLNNRKEINQRLREILGVNQSSLIILFVSNNWRRKGLDVLIRALALVNNQGFKHHLLVVGKGNKNPYERLAMKEGVKDNIHFVGFQENMPSIYKGVDLFVLPTLYDPFANVCLEAMACGVPVITSSSNGASEILKDGTNGYILNDPRNISYLAELIGQIRKDSELDEMSKKAFKTSLKYSMESNIEQTLSLFNSFLES